MKRIVSYLMILLLVFPTVLAEEEYEEFGEDFQNTIKKIEDGAKKIQDLIKKYEEKKLPVIKTEDVTITDQNGKGVACEFSVYYDNYEAFKMNTGKDGKYTGDFKHGNTWPQKPISVNIHKCQCRIEDFEHVTSFPQFDEHIERIRSLIKDEVESYAGDKAKDAAKKLVEKGFSAAGAENLAGPFLWGFGVGADLGKPFGEALTQGINKILDARLNIRKAEHEAGMIAPRGEPKTARWNIPVVNWFRTKPILKNTWKVNVVCGEQIDGSYSSERWRSFDDYKIKETEPTKTYVPPPKRDEEIDEEKEREEEQRRWEEEQRKREEERRKQEEEEARRRDEEARKRAAALEAKAQQIREECKICDPIREQIKESLDKMKELEDRLNELDKEVNDAQGKTDKAKRDLERARRALDDFNNPQSWAESDGRRVTSTDLAIDRMVAAGAWARYRNGEISAEQLEQEWANYDDEAREGAKEAYKKKLEEDIANAEKAHKDAESKLKDLTSERSSKSQSLANLKKHLEDLHKQLEDCLKLCKEKAKDIARGVYLDYTELLDDKEEPVTTTQPTISQRTDCDKYELLISRYQIDSAKAASMSEVEWLERGMSENMYKAMLQYKKICDQTKGLVSTGQTEEYEEEKEEVITEEVSEPKTCEELCSERGRSTSRKDWTSYILGELNSNGVCASSASIGLPTILKVNDCTCYSTTKPTIQISSTKLVCKNTACGDVACGSSTECSCGENCVQTVSCNWGGWQKVSDNAYQPVVG